MSGLLVDGENPFILPIAEGRSLRNDEIDFHVRFPDDPALLRTVRIGFELPQAVSPAAERQPGSLAAEAVTPVLVLDQMPLLVPVVLFVMPLECRVLVIAAGIVDCQEGIAVEQLVQVAAQRFELPQAGGTLRMAWIGKQER